LDYEGRGAQAFAGATNVLGANEAEKALFGECVDASAGKGALGVDFGGGRFDDVAYDAVDGRLVIPGGCAQTERTFPLINERGAARKGRRGGARFRPDAGGWHAAPGSAVTCVDPGVCTGQTENRRTKSSAGAFYGVGRLASARRTWNC